MEKETIRAFLHEKLSVDVSAITDTTPILSESYIDSFSLVELLAFIEQQESIIINAIDVNLSNFDTIQGMLDYIKSKKETTNDTN
jgi:acyl carrier protein